MSGHLTLNSPDGCVIVSIAVENGRLTWWATRDGVAMIEPAPLGVTVDSADLGRDVALGEPIPVAELDETYPMRGAHSTGRCRCRAVSLSVTHRPTGTVYTLDLRAFDDGVAYRYRIPGGETGERRVTGEESAWRLPTGARVWYAERPNAWKLKSYAGWWTSAPVEEMPAISPGGPVQCPPLVVELPAGGYLALTEAALFGYSGMRLRGEPERRFVADFTEGESGFSVAGEIVTPWRVTLISPDLNGLVNSDILTSLCPPPDPAAYPGGTDWIRLGRAVWRWWSAGTGTPAEEREFIDHAAALGFEFSLVDDGWKDWPGDPWAEIARLCVYGRERNVGVLVWKDYNDFPQDDFPASIGELRAWLDRCVAAGITGVKIDFFNAEDKGKIDWQAAAHRLTAERKLLLFFHGCQKPTGEARTWPHEITREGIRGLELNKMTEGPVTAEHNAALPFTRFVAGHGDYTPLGYSRPGATTWAHQLATVVLFTSPLQVIGEHPEMLLTDPEAVLALDVLRAIPSVWEETRVLEPPSRIGHCAVMARHAANGDWFVAGISGTALVEHIPLAGIPSGGRAVLLTCPAGERTGFVRREWGPGDDGFSQKTLSLAPDDGFVLWIRAA